MKTDSSSRATIGDRVRDARLRLSLSQEDVAARAGTSQPVIQKIENGKSLRPRIIPELAKALSLTPSWISFGEYPPALARIVATLRATPCEVGPIRKGKKKYKDCNEAREDGVELGPEAGICWPCDVRWAIKTIY